MLLLWPRSTRFSEDTASVIVALTRATRILIAEIPLRSLKARGVMLGTILLLQRVGCLGGVLPAGCANENAYLILKDAFHLVCEQQTEIL